MDKLSIIYKNFENSIKLKQQVFADEKIVKMVEDVSNSIINTYKNGGKVLFCGNGGSAADSQHLAAELSGRYYYDRPPLSSEALHVNTSYLTAVANDYSYEQIYSRLVKATAKKGDILIGLSTSGNSKNVVKAMEEAKAQGMITVAMTGVGGGEMAAFADFLIDIPSKDTPRIQECHMMIGHAICEIVEQGLFPNED